MANDVLIVMQDVWVRVSNVFPNILDSLQDVLNQYQVKLSYIVLSKEDRELPLVVGAVVNPSSEGGHVSPDCRGEISDILNQSDFRVVFLESWGLLTQVFDKELKRVRIHFKGRGKGIVCTIGTGSNATSVPFHPKDERTDAVKTDDFPTDLDKLRRELVKLVNNKLEKIEELKKYRVDENKVRAYLIDYAPAYGAQSIEKARLEAAKIRSKINIENIVHWIIEQIRRQKLNDDDGIVIEFRDY